MWPPESDMMTSVLNKLETEIESLKYTVCSQMAEINILSHCLEGVQMENLELEARNALLEKELSLYRIKKNSSNSSIPPSQDPHRIKRTESLRKSSARKPGGQPGHEGSCLEMVSEPDKTILHMPGYCKCCGGDLSAATAQYIGKRQVIDTPPVKPVVTEHQIFGKRCQCGHVTEGDYPPEAHSPVCYGPRIQGLTAYLHSRQYIPYDRIREFYADVLGLSISSGCLVNMIECFADKSKGIYQEIRRRVVASPVVGADETGVNINGKNRWAWVFQTPKLTYIDAGLSRSKKVVDEIFPQGFPKSVLVHDCWTSYFGIQTRGHQICVAHLLRELEYLGKLYKEQQWTANFSALLHKALELKKTLLVAEDYLLHNSPQRSILEEDTDQMLNQTTHSEYKKLTAFKERIQKRRHCLLTFLYDPQVPPDNNASERAIRTFKVKQKVSGLFRKQDGAKTFAVIRSIIDTTIKNGQNVLEALALIAVTPVSFQDSS